MEVNYLNISDIHDLLAALMRQADCISGWIVKSCVLGCDANLWCWGRCYLVGLLETTINGDGTNIADGEVVIVEVEE